MLVLNLLRILAIGVLCSEFKLVMPMNDEASEQKNYIIPHVSRLNQEGCGIRRVVGVNSALEGGPKFDWRSIESDSSSSSSNDSSPATDDGHAFPDNATANHSELESRIVGGETSNTSWPWMLSSIHSAAIWYRGDFICGGSVLDNRHILTAAHCFDKKPLKPERYTVHVGALSKDHPEAGTHAVAQVRLHEGYKPIPHMHHDIAVVRLREPLPPYVVPVCVAERDTLTQGTHTTVIGWGRTTHGGEYAEYLQELHGLKILDAEECNARLAKKDKKFKGVQIYQICAGGDEAGQKDACQGDSGGPLIRQHENGRWYQEGIVSFGYGCAKPGIPGLYTKVATYTWWLDDFMASSSEE